MLTMHAAGQSDDATAAGLAEMFDVTRYCIQLDVVS